MKNTLAKLAIRILVLTLLFSFGVKSLLANIYINEIYFDPPGSTGDLFAEYIELRGDPNMDLSDHYLIFLENESSLSADPGEIDYMFDLGALSDPRLGSNGFMTLRMAGNVYDFSPGSVSEIAPGTRDYVNGSGTLSWMDQFGNTTIGFSGEDGKRVLENSGFTAMLIRNDGDPNDAPVVPLDPNAVLMDLDDDDDNELDPNGPLTNWAILDSVGVNSEASDIDGFLYAPVNFSAGTPVGGGNVPAGAIFVDLGYEIEKISRWGDSTGSTAADWHATNLTNDTQSGYDGPEDYRQSGDPHGVTTDPNNINTDPNTGQFVETNQGVPYGTYLTDSLGSTNFFVLDGDVNPTFDGEEFVFDGIVDARDFLVMQRNQGIGAGLGTIKGFTATRQHGDTNNDRKVGSGDIEVWGSNYGTTLSIAAATTVPEPTALVLLMAGCSLLAVARRR